MIIIIVILLYVIAWSVAPEAMAGLHVFALYAAITLAVIGGIVLLVASA